MSQRHLLHLRPHAGARRAPGRMDAQGREGRLAGAFEGWEPEVQAMVDVSEVDVCTTLDARARRRLETRVLDELKRG